MHGTSPGDPAISQRGQDFPCRPGQSLSLGSRMDCCPPGHLAYFCPPLSVPAVDAGGPGTPTLGGLFSPSALVGPSPEFCNIHECVYGLCLLLLPKVPGARTAHRWAILRRQQGSCSPPVRVGAECEAGPSPSEEHPRAAPSMASSLFQVLGPLLCFSSFTSACLPPSYKA